LFDSHLILKLSIPDVDAPPLPPENQRLLVLEGYFLIPRAIFYALFLAMQNSHFLRRAEGILKI
jgi:hypothetical protein